MNQDIQDTVTPAALLEQLVYVDTFMPEIDDPTTLDERLTAELSAFADDSFVFPDEEKPQNSGDEENNNNNNNININDNNNNSTGLLNRFSQMNDTFSPQGRRNEAKQFNTLQSSSYTSSLSSVLTPLSSLQSSSATQTQQPSQQSNTQSSDRSSDLLSRLPKVHVPAGAQSSLIAAGLNQTQIDALAALVAQHQGNGTNNTRIKEEPQDIHNLDNVLNSFKNDGFLGRNQSTDSNNHGSLNPSVTTSNGGVTPTSSGGTPLDLHHSRRNSKVDSVTGDADLDKRRRNTEASARFRIKKKIKEQQLERSVRELNELTLTLEKKIQTLEMENKLLRNLVVEKGEQRNNEEVENLKRKVRLETTSEVSGGNSLNGFGGGTSTF